MIFLVLHFVHFEASMVFRSTQANAGYMNLRPAPHLHPYGPQYYLHRVVSLNKGTPIRGPQHTITIVMGTPKMVPQILGNPHI